jgi:hypothetical protein
MRALSTVVAGFVALALIVAPNTRAADCASAANRYAVAAAKVTEALRTFEKCIASGDKRNDCTDEFEALDGAHDDFVDAVGDLKTCP